MAWWRNLFCPIDLHSHTDDMRR